MKNWEDDIDMKASKLKATHFVGIWLDGGSSTLDVAKGLAIIHNPNYLI